MWRQVQNKGLTTKYNADEYFRLNIKKLIALAFVPLDQIITVFDLIVNQLDDDDNDDLIDFLKKHGLISQKEEVMFFSILELLKRHSTFPGTGRKNPQFDHKLWIIHDHIVANLTRSNNSVEV